MDLGFRKEERVLKWCSFTYMDILWLQNAKRPVGII